MSRLVCAVAYHAVPPIISTRQFRCETSTRFADLLISFTTVVRYPPPGTHFRNIDSQSVFCRQCRALHRPPATAGRAEVEAGRKKDIRLIGGVWSGGLGDYRMASAGERAYNGSLGAESPLGSSGKTPGQGGKAP